MQPALRYLTITVVLVAVALVGCDTKKKTDKTGDKTTAGADNGTKPEPNTKPDPVTKPPAASGAPTDSKDILDRTEVAKETHVKHILVSWKELAPAFRGRQDPKGAARTREEADKLAVEIADKLRADSKQLDALTKEYSEDPGSLAGNAYKVTANARLVPEFKNLGLRLKMGEVGIVKTNYGHHVMIRVEPPPPPPPDPLDSVDILKREPVTDKAKVKHILLGWTEANAGDPRGQKRTREELDALVKETVAKLKKGEAIEPLMKELSEDPGSAKTGSSYDATPSAGLVPPFKNLSLRLKKDEVGVVKTRFGIHIIKRVE